jgi:hypothetical protein
MLLPAVGKRNFALESLAILIHSWIIAASGLRTKRNSDVRASAMAIVVIPRSTSPGAVAVADLPHNLIRYADLARVESSTLAARRSHDAAR